METKRGIRLHADRGAVVDTMHSTPSYTPIYIQILTLGHETDSTTQPTIERYTLAEREKGIEAVRLTYRSEGIIT